PESLPECGADGLTVADEVAGEDHQVEKVQRPGSLLPLFEASNQRLHLRVQETGEVGIGNLLERGERRDERGSLVEELLSRDGLRIHRAAALACLRQIAIRRKRRQQRLQ